MRHWLLLLLPDFYNYKTGALPLKNQVNSLDILGRNGIQVDRDYETQTQCPPTPRTRISARLHLQREGTVTITDQNNGTTVRQWEGNVKECYAFKRAGIGLSQNLFRMCMWRMRPPARLMVSPGHCKYMSYYYALFNLSGTAGLT